MSMLPQSVLAAKPDWVGRAEFPPTDDCSCGYRRVFQAERSIRRRAVHNFDFSTEGLRTSPPCLPNRTHRQRMTELSHHLVEMAHVASNKIPKTYA